MAERNEENYDLLHQNLIKKYEDDLEHKVVYILYDLWVFSDVTAVQFRK